jgi:hypothetical protein
METLLYSTLRQIVYIKMIFRIRTYLAGIRRYFEGIKLE